MAFVCDLENDKVSLDYYRNGAEHTVVVLVGHDPDRQIVYLLHVGLSPMVGGDVEYYFFIVERDVAADEETERWCGRDTRAVLKGEDRKRVLGAVCSATALLLNQARPERVFRITYEPHLPDKALEKHHLVSHMFTACGYEVTASDPYHGKRCWWAERTHAPTSPL